MAWNTIGTRSRGISRYIGPLGWDIHFHSRSSAGMREIAAQESTIGSESSPATRSIARFAGSKGCATSG